jgi:phosphate transport system substrate-binding protein
MHKSKGIAFGAVVVAIALFTAACGSSGGTGGSGLGRDKGQTLTGAGATFPAPLYQKWNAEVNTKYGVQVNYQAIGSGGGIAQITAKTVDFGASDAPMKDEELAKITGNSILHIPMAFGAVVVTYNLPGITAPLKLDSDAIAGLFLGTIKKWNDPALAALNPGVTLPATAVSVVHRSDGSGTTNTFTSFLDKVNANWHAKVGKGKEVEWPVGIGGSGNAGVSAAVKLTPGTVGYVELAFANKNSLPAADVKNSSGSFVTPSLASTTAAAAGAVVPDDLRFSVVNAPGADAYPICSATWLLVYKDQTDKTKGQTLVDYLWWATHDGQADAEALLYAKLPASLVTKAEEKIKSIEYNGKALY